MSPTTVHARSCAAERRDTRARARSASEAATTTAGSPSPDRQVQLVPRTASVGNPVDAVAESSGEPVAHVQRRRGIGGASDAQRPTQVLLVDDDVVDRPVADGAQVLDHRVGQPPPLGDQLGHVPFAARVDLRRSPFRAVVVGLVPGDHVGADPDHVRHEVSDGPVGAGGDPGPHRRGRRRAHQPDDALLRGGPLGHRVERHGPCRMSAAEYPSRAPGCPGRRRPSVERVRFLQ